MIIQLSSFYLILYVNQHWCLAALIAPLIAIHFLWPRLLSFSVGMLLGLTNFLFRIKWFKDIHNAVDLKPFSLGLFGKMLLRW